MRGTSCGPRMHAQPSSIYTTQVRAHSVTVKHCIYVCMHASRFQFEVVHGGPVVLTSACFNSCHVGEWETEHVALWDQCVLLKPEREVTGENPKAQSCIAYETTTLTRLGSMRLIAQGCEQICFLRTPKPGLQSMWRGDCTAAVHQTATWRHCARHWTKPTSVGVCPI